MKQYMAMQTRVMEWLAALPDTITYHNASHTREVVQCAESLADLTGLYAQERELLKLAALFHDTGFQKAYHSNEEYSCEIAAELMAPHYSDLLIERVQDIIMATKIFTISGVVRQCPGQDLLRQLMCDADLYNLGSPDFFDLAHRLRLELGHHAKVTMTDLEWFQMELNLLQTHTWATSAAHVLMADQKAANITALEAAVAHLKAHPNQPLIRMNPDIRVLDHAHA